MSFARARAGLVLLTALVLSAGCRFGDNSLPEAEEQQIPVAQAERGPFLVVAQEVGVLAASQSVRLRAPFWGRIAELIPEGTQVESGDVLLKMDVEEIEKRIVRRRQDVRASEGELGELPSNGE